MKAFPVTVFLFFLSYGIAGAQDSIPEPRPPKVKPDFRFGLNIAQTIAGILHPTAVLLNTDPYQFTFRLGNKRVGWRNGLNFANKKTELKDPFQGERTTRTRSVEWRTGVERNFQVSDRFELYWGLDLSMGRVVDKVTFGGGGGSSTLDTKQTKLGLGPAIGVVWHIHKRVSLSTECSVYGIYTWEKTKIRAFPDVSENSTTQSQFSPVLPSSLFINYYF